MGNYIYSTLSADVNYNIYVHNSEGHPLVAKSIHIKGGSGIAGKHFITPLGVRTEISDEELSLLENDEVFKTHKANGFVSISKADINPEVAAADMETRDGSAPAVPEDFKETSKDGKTNRSFTVKNKLQ